MANKYSIIIDTQINSAQLQSQITQIQQQVQQQINNSGGSGLINIINPTATNKDIEAVKTAIQGLKSDIATIDKVKITYDENDNPSKAIVDYTNNVGLAQNAVLEIDQKTKDWALAQTGVTENLAQTRAEIQKNIEAQAAAQEKMQALNDAGLRQQEVAKQQQQEKLQALNDAGLRQQEVNQQKSLEKMQALNDAGMRAQEIADQKQEITRETYLEKYQNKLQVIQAQNAEAFNNDKYPEVDKALVDIQAQLATFDGSAEGVRNLGLSFDDLSTKVKLANQDIENTGNNLINTLEHAAIKFATWMVAATLFMGTVREIEAGIQYVEDMNKELTNIEMITNSNSESVGVLGQNYNQLASQLGSTTLEVTKSAETWLRQGKSIQDTNTLLEASIKLSKLSGTTAEESATSLTAIMNGFKLSADQVSSVLDKMVVLANSSSTTASVSIQQLSDALQKSANSAVMAGLSYDELLSYLTTIETVTQKNADSIGSSLDFILARYQNVKAGAKVDDLGESLNNVETSLKTLGIEIRNESDGSFKPFGTIINEISGKWNTLNNAQQSEIATALAGTRNRENLIALLNNYNKTLEYQTGLANSAGAAQNAYSKYLDSTEAAMNRLTDAANKLASDTISGGLIKFFIDFAANLVNLIDKAGIFNTILVGLGIFLTTKFSISIPLITGLIDNLAVSFGLATDAAASLSVVLSGAILGAAVFGIVYAYEQMNKSSVDAYANFEKLRSQTDSNVSELESLAKEYENLANKQNKSSDDVNRLSDIQTILNDKYNIAVNGVNAYTAAIDNNSTAIGNNVKAIKELEIEQDRQFLEKNKDAYEQDTKFLNDKSFSLKNNVYGANVTGTPQEQVDQLNKMLQDFAKSPFKDWTIISDTLKKQRDSIQEQIDDAQKLINTYDDYEEKINLAVKKTQDAYEALHFGPTKDMFPESFIAPLSDLNTELTDLDNTSKLVYDTIDKNNQGLLTFADAQKLMAADPKFSDALTIEGDRVKVNTDLLQEYNIQKIKDQLNSVNAALAQDKYNTELQKQQQILAAYLHQAENAVAQSADFTKNLDVMLQTVASKMNSTEINKGFKSIATNLVDINKQFRAGEITATEYTDALNKSIQGIDITKTFGKNTDAAKTFFSGMALDAAQTLSEINSKFRSGGMLLTDYTKSVANIGAAFMKLQNNIDMLGKGNTEMDAAFTETAKDVKTLNDLQETNVAIQKVYSEQAKNSLQFGTEAYNQAMQSIANAAAASGQTFTDADGKVLQSSQNIYGYLTDNVENFNTFADQTGKKTGDSINNIMGALGTMLQRIGKDIQEFKVDIKFTPQETGNGLTIFQDLAKYGVTPITLPSFTYSISADGNNSLSDIGAAVAEFGASLTASSNVPTDSSIYKIPTQMNQVTGSVGDASNAFDNLANSTKNAGDSTKDLSAQESALNDLLKDTVEVIKQKKEAEKQALQDSLDGYKKIIDAKKSELDAEKAAHDYQAEVNDETATYTKLEQQINVLKLDNSQEAQAKLLDLEDQANKAKQQLDKTAYDHSIDTQKDALDKEYSNYETYIQDKEKVIEDYLKNSGQMNIDAMKLIDSKDKQLYDDLIAWNKQYGTGIDQDITSMWNNAYNVLGNYKDSMGKLDFSYAIEKIKALQSAVDNLNNSLNGGGGGSSGNYKTTYTGTNPTTNSGTPSGSGLSGSKDYQDYLLKNYGIKTHHTGLASGPIGDLSTATNEIFTKAMAGEVILNETDMLGIMARIPQLAQNISSSAGVSGGNLTVGNLINIEGNVDKSTVKDIDKIANQVVEKINYAMQRNGFNRNALITSI